MYIYYQYRKIIFVSTNDSSKLNDNEIRTDTQCELMISYFDIIFHALSKENFNIMVQLNISDKNMKYYKTSNKLENYEKLFIKPANPKDSNITNNSSFGYI